MISHTTRLSVVAVAGVAILLYLIIRRKLHPFVSLLLVSVLIGLGVGMQPATVLKAMQTGMGNTLGFVAVVVGLGAMFGQMLEVSGGAQVLARQLLATFSAKNARWALGIAGFLISIPVFLDVGFVILVPILYGLTRKSGKSLINFALPLLAGMAVTHAFIPPTPGPIGVADILDANLGWVILFGVVTGIPAMVLAGPVFTQFIVQRVPGKIPAYMDIGEDDETPEHSTPGFGTIFFLIFLPILLILLGTISNALLTDATIQSAGDSGVLYGLRDTLVLIGHPFIALLLTTMLCFWLLGTRRGMRPEHVNAIATRALEPAGIVILVTGAGGVLKQILVESEVGALVAGTMTSYSIPIILAAFMLAMVIRVMQGSATVAMLTAASLVSPILDSMGPDDMLRALMVIPIAAGATAFGHVNDSAFWLVNRYLGLSVPDTLRSFTVMTAIVGVVGVLMAMLLSVLIS